MKKTKVGIIFGSRSVEHEISVITAYQVIEAIDREKYEPIPIYITKDGKWMLGPCNIEAFKKEIPNREIIFPPIPKAGLIKKGVFHKRIDIDIAFPLVHGTYGEDGTLQGLLELADIPYVGSSVLGSSLCMDKIASKRIFKSLGFPIVDWLCFERGEKGIIEDIEKNLSYPVIVKPSNLGSSIGVNTSSNKDELSFALDVCFEYSQKAIVEKALSSFSEINCAILGEREVIPSLCEEVIKEDKFLTYSEKYRKGKGMKGISRKIPAEISDELTKKIQNMAIGAFKACSLSGIARIDFLLKDNEIYINEINTIPGSLSFYLFKPLGIEFKELITRLIELGFEAYNEKKKTKFSYELSIF
ncbi:MAG: D-alanine--D-alanine ligase family protein [bacterium]